MHNDLPSNDTNRYLFTAVAMQERLNTRVSFWILANRIAKEGNSSMSPSELTQKCAPFQNMKHARQPANLFVIDSLPLSFWVTVERLKDDFSAEVSKEALVNASDLTKAISVMRGKALATKKAIPMIQLIGVTASVECIKGFMPRLIPQESGQTFQMTSQWKDTCSVLSIAGTFSLSARSGFLPMLVSVNDAIQASRFDTMQTSASIRPIMSEGSISVPAIKGFLPFIESSDSAARNESTAKQKDKPMVMQVVPSISVMAVRGFLPTLNATSLEKTMVAASKREIEKAQQMSVPSVMHATSSVKTVPAYKGFLPLLSSVGTEKVIYKNKTASTAAGASETPACMKVVGAQAVASRRGFMPLLNSLASERSYLGGKEKATGR